MGLIKAAFSAGRSTLADQWKEFFTIDSMNTDVLVRRGEKRVNSGSNTKGSEGVITNGSVIAVPVGTAMVITDNGKIVEFTAEAGEYTYNSSTEPSCFSGSFGNSILKSFETFGRRFTYGGETARDQRVYFINIKEIFGNKFGTATPMSYPDPKYMNIYIRYYGQYTFKVCDPIKFFVNISGNVDSQFYKSNFLEQTTAEFNNALDSALNNCANEGIVFSSLPSQQMKIAKYMNDALDTEWIDLRGIEVVSVAIEKVTPDDKSRERIEKFDTADMMSNANRAVGRMVEAQATAFEEAAKNPNGAMNGFVGLGMVGGMANVMGAGQSPLNFVQQGNSTNQNTAPVSANLWNCSCGATNEGKFCKNCGVKKPETTATASDKWICSCSATNSGKFCSECGAPRPKALKAFKCNKCGWVPENKEQPPKFCPECGDKFDENDII